MSSTRFLVGTSGYSYKPWKGSFYPKDLPATRMLGYYAEHFQTVEINGTFYRMPTAPVVKAWAGQVPDDFLFVLKAPQRITHFQRLRGAEESTAEFLKAAAALKKQLGPLLFQLPGNFKKDPARLHAFLKQLPKSLRIAFEFRHASWFDQEIFDLLGDSKAALCVAETEGPETPAVFTTDWGYLRLRLAEYSDIDLRKWITWARRQKWREAFVFFKHEDKGNAPRFARRFLELAGQDR